jgi:hypothetical protein
MVESQNMERALRVITPETEAEYHLDEVADIAVATGLVTAQEISIAC